MFSVTFKFNDLAAITVLFVTKSMEGSVRQEDRNRKTDTDTDADTKKKRTDRHEYKQKKTRQRKEESRSIKIVSRLRSKLEIQ